MTASGRRRSAISLAWRVRDRNGLVIDRDTNHVSTIAVPSTTIASTTNHSWRFRAASRSESLRALIWSATASW